MKKSSINFKELSRKFRERIENNVSEVRLHEYLYGCATESKTLAEFYKKLQQDPQYKLYESEGTIKGVIYKERHVFLFEKYIANEHKILV